MNIPPMLSKCLCNISECKEKGKICWENDGGQYFHIRVNGCIELLHDLKKTDCVILHPTHKGKIYTFIIEVKTTCYDLDEVKEKIEHTLRVLDSFLNGSLVPIPIVYAKSHKNLKRYAFQKKINYKGRKYLIKFLKHCDSIQKAMIQ
ncbi:MAG: hypothetical protein NDF57_07410 [archaeon GBS-70-058]|nr:hypothetical protein [Candidatus Culexarchaeum nevadense]